MASDSHKDIAHLLLQAQDDSDTVVLPNACRGQVVELADSARIRCFSVITRQPHTVPAESWTMLTVPPMPDAEGMHSIVKDRLLVDHVTRGIIGDNAVQYMTSEDGNIASIRLLPPGTAPAQQQWEAQASKMIE